jgi:hypothetical protein
MNRLYSEKIMDHMLFVYDFDRYLIHGREVDDEPLDRKALREVLGFKENWGHVSPAPA